MNKLFSIGCLLLCFQLAAQDIVPLYSSTITNSTLYRMKEIVTEQDEKILSYRKVSVPSLATYLPDKEAHTGVAVIICPGGGYFSESYQKEGIEIAETFMSHGIAAFILKYRLPCDSIMKDKSIGPLQDAQQAIKTVRMNASKWRINPQKIGIMGFSAGGHLASTAGTHFDRSYIPNEENINLRPDFMILVYPVISMDDEITHKGSQINLLGEKPSRDQIEFYSNELHVNANTPPAWITHTGDDAVVPVENSIRFYKELVQNKVATEMHLYPKGNHGFVLRMPTEEWMIPLFKWMIKSEIVN